MLHTDRLEQELDPTRPFMPSQRFRDSLRRNFCARSSPANLGQATHTESLTMFGKQRVDLLVSLRMKEDVFWRRTENAAKDRRVVKSFDREFDVKRGVLTATSSSHNAIDGLLGYA